MNINLEEIRLTGDVENSFPELLQMVVYCEEILKKHLKTDLIPVKLFESVLCTYFINRCQIETDPEDIKLNILSLRGVADTLQAHLDEERS